MALVVLLVLQFWKVSYASIVGAVVLPHGDFAYDPELVNKTGGSVELHDASLKAGQYIMELKPDVVFLTTPHGLELSQKYLIYLNTHLSGASPLGDVPHTTGPQSVPMNLTTNVGLAGDLLLTLQADKSPVEGLQGFSDSEPLPISWGEILPMSYLSPTDPTIRPRVVILGIPTKRFNHSAEMVDELLDMGRRIGHFLESRTERIAWLVSSDLAHTHLASGPYGFCSCAQLFDDAVERWAADSDSDALLRDATLYQKLGAASCGFTGLVMLEGMLQESGRTVWRSESLANFHPTYYGMMVATFSRQRTVLVM